MNESQHDLNIESINKQGIQRDRGIGDRMKEISDHRGAKAKWMRVKMRLKENYV